MISLKERLHLNRIDNLFAGINGDAVEDCDELQKGLETLVHGKINRGHNPFEKLGILHRDMLHKTGKISDQFEEGVQEYTAGMSEEIEKSDREINARTDTFEGVLDKHYVSDDDKSAEELLANIMKH